MRWVAAGALPLAPLLGLACFASEMARAAPRPRVLAVAVGLEGEQIGELQRAVHEHLLALAELESIPVTAMSVALPTHPLTPPRPGLVEEVTRLMAAAQAAYYADRAIELTAALDAVTTLYAEQGEARATELASLLLWRGAAALAASRPKVAQDFARQALRHDPDLVVDLEVFRPSVKALVDETRRQLGEAFAVVVETWPPGATARLDGAALAEPVVRIAGDYRLEVSAPGFRTLSRTIKVPNVVRVRVNLPSDVDSRLEIATWRGEWLAAERQALAALLDGLALDCLATVAARTRPRAELRGLVSCRRGASWASPIFAASGQGELELMRWLKQTVLASPIAAPADGAGWRGEITGGLGGARRARVVDAADGVDLGTAHLGAGTEVRLELESPTGLLLEGGASFAALTSRATVGLATHEQRRLGGGMLGRARVGLGYAFDSQLGRLAVSAGAGAERLATDDLALDGSRLGIAPGHTSWGADVHLDGRLAMTRLGGGYALSADLGVTIAPWRTREEQPAGATGSQPSPLPSLGWRAALVARGAWIVGAFYEGGVGWVRFHGTALAPHWDTVRAARVLETLHAAGLLIGASL